MFEEDQELQVQQPDHIILLTSFICNQWEMMRINCLVKFVATKKAISEREEGVTVVINLNKIKCYFHPNEGESSGMIITDWSRVNKAQWHSVSAKNIPSITYQTDNPEWRWGNTDFSRNNIFYKGKVLYWIFHLHGFMTPKVKFKQNNIFHEKLVCLEWPNMHCKYQINIFSFQILGLWTPQWGPHPPV